jgi:arylsulfatase A-like enzyme
MFESIVRPTGARAATLRRWLAAAFAGQFALLEALVGTLRMSTGAAAVRLVSAASFGWLCFSLARARHTRAAVAAAAAAYVVVETAFYRHYHAPIDTQVLESLLFAWPDVRPVVGRALPGAVVLAAAVAAIEYVWLAHAARAIGARRPLTAGAATFALAASLAAPARAVVGRIVEGPGARVAPASLPRLPSTKARMPNVLFVLTESVRSSEVCAAHGEPCATTPEVDALVPDRMPLREMRAVASYTAVSVAALLTGRPPARATDEIVPSLFEFVKASRIREQGPTLAYWSAQTDSLFSRRDVRRTVDSFVAVNDLVGHAVADEDEVIDRGLDRLLAEHVEAEVGALPEPFVLVLHFQGTHAPYFTDDARAPFQPMRHSVTWSGLPELRNAYRNAIVEQDHHIARCLRAFFRRVNGSPYVVFFTSDHGEAFGEHGAIHHGQNLYDEQLHVPAWVAAGNGGLAETEVSNLRAYEKAVVTHLDVLPTVLDVMGVLDGYAMAGYRRALAGRSLVAAREPLAEPVPVTNCTSLFPCPLRTWGVFDEARALIAQQWDGDFRCTTLAGTPEDAASAACGRLRAASRKWFATKPNGAPNR